MIKFSASIVTLLAWSICSATTYYVSPSGNDASSGTSQANAWQTMQRVSQVMNTLSPGDQILFQRGATYRGSLSILSSGTASSPIVFGSYGSGAEPVISGSTPVSGWTSAGGGIWQAPLATTPTYIFVNSQLMTLARTPNAGWLRMENGGTDWLQDDQLPSGTWTGGGQAVIRSTMWSYDVVNISSQNGTTINYPTIYYNLAGWDWGYFLQNKLSALDAAGEWYHDSGAGILYLKPPGGTDPNASLVEASVQDYGFRVEWMRHHVRIQDLHFEHQKTYSIRLDGGYSCTIDNCTFSQARTAVSTYGNDNVITDNHLHDIYASGIWTDDDNILIENNLLQDIAVVPGLGESNWGYFGIRTLAPQGVVVRGNRLERIGYNGIEAKGDALVEKNRVDQAVYILNDGGAIAFDNANGMMIRQNIVTNVVGDIGSAATMHTNYYPISIGIYFGNTSILNTTVTANTVSGCAGAGIYVDHTMISTNNQITNNVLFNNEVQAKFSDHSNYNGPGATPPYYLPSYNDVFTGNVLCALGEDQLCLQWTWVHNATSPVDFGTFNNNVYYSPYKEQSIFVHNHLGGQFMRHTLLNWQTVRGEDPNSIATNKRWSSYDVTNVQSGNLINSGTFDYNVNGWSANPSSAPLAHDYTFLDNGAMKASFPNPGTYPHLNVQNDQQVGIQTGQWYRMLLSLQSTSQGEVDLRIHPNSIPWGQASMFSKYLPFDGARRDHEVFFQSDRNDQMTTHLLTAIGQSTYWVDNVELYRVQVQLVDPLATMVLHYNDQPTSQTVTPVGCWSDPYGTLVSEPFTLAPYTARVLIKEDDVDCGLSTPVHDIGEASDQLSVFPSPIVSGGQFQVELPWATGLGQLRMMDAKGQQVFATTVQAGLNVIMPPIILGAGLYLITIEGQGSPQRGRLVVQ